MGTKLALRVAGSDCEMRNGSTGIEVQTDWVRRLHASASHSQSLRQARATSNIATHRSAHRIGHVVGNDRNEFVNFSGREVLYEPATIRCRQSHKARLAIGQGDGHSHQVTYVRAFLGVDQITLLITSRRRTQPRRQLRRCLPGHQTVRRPTPRSGPGACCWKCRVRKGSS